jgi:hypothetical protein
MVSRVNRLRAVAEVDGSMADSGALLDRQENGENLVLL